MQATKATPGMGTLVRAVESTSVHPLALQSRACPPERMKGCRYRIDLNLCVLGAERELLLLFWGLVRLEAWHDLSMGAI
jgi:hypothetical protein